MSAKSEEREWQGYKVNERGKKVGTGQGSGLGGAWKWRGESKRETGKDGREGVWEELCTGY